jgi:hypothetical protein
MKNRLEKHVGNIVPSTQMAFKGRTTTTAILYIESIIRCAWANGKVVSILSLDMSGAYNRLNRQKLLDLMWHQHRIPPEIVKMICSYLSFRRTTIKIPGHISSHYYIDRGVPQGSPLSPILFLLYTTLLLEILCEQDPDGKSLRFTVAFADDNYIIRVDDSIPENCKKLSTDMKLCEKWAEDHDMAFGRHKLEAMNFSRSRNDAEHLDCRPDIAGFQAPDPNKPGMKVLGVVFDSKLNWQYHMEHVCKTCT